MDCHDILIKIFHFCEIKDLKSLRIVNALISLASKDILFQKGWFQQKQSRILFPNDYVKIRQLKNVKNLNLHKYHNITHLKFNQKFNSPLSPLSLPNTIKFLDLGETFNQKIDNLPESLESLVMSKDFNQSIDHLPQNLQSLQINQNFAHSLANLPKNLRRLVFHPMNSKFQETLINLPKSLKILKLGLYNQKLNLCSTQIRYLAAGFNYNIPLSDLPPTLVTVLLGYKYSHPLSNLPPSLKTIFICNKGYEYFDQIPKHVQIFVCPTFDRFDPTSI